MTGNIRRWGYPELLGSLRGAGGGERPGDGPREASGSADAAQGQSEGDPGDGVKGPEGVGLGRRQGGAAGWHEWTSRSPRGDAPFPGDNAAGRHRPAGARRRNAQGAAEGAAGWQSTDCRVDAD